MDFLNISLWLVTAILSVSSQRSQTSQANCNPNYPFNYLKLADDPRNCFCFSNKNDHKKVPDVIYPEAHFVERLVYYVYKDNNGLISLYIPNREKQFLIPDLAFDEGDHIIENPSDIIHSFHDLKVVLETNRHKYTNKRIEINGTVTAVTADEPTSTTETPPTITDKVTVTNEKPTTTTEKPTLATQKLTFSTEEYTVTTKEPTTVTNKPTVSFEEKTVNEINTTTTGELTSTSEGPTTVTDEPSETNKNPTLTTEKPTGTTNKPTVAFEKEIVTNVIRTTTTDKPTGTTVGLTTITDEPYVTNKQLTVTTEKPTGSTNEPTVTFEKETVTNLIRTTTTHEPTGTTGGPTTISDEPSVTNKQLTVTTEKPTGSTNEPTVTFEKETVTNLIKTTTTHEPTGTTGGPTTIFDEPSITNKQLTVTTEKPTGSTNEPTVTIEKEYVINVRKTTSTDKPTGTTGGPTTISDEPSVTNKQLTVTPEKPTGSTNEPTVTFEKETVTNLIRTTTTHEPTGTTGGPTTISDEPSVTNKKPTVTTENPTGTTNEPTVIIEKETVTNVIRTTTTDKPTGTTVRPTTITDEPYVTNKRLTDTTENPTSSTDELTVTFEKETVTNIKRTSTTDEHTGTTNEPTVTIEKETVTNVINTTTTNKPIGTTVGPTTITDEPHVTNKKPISSTENPTGATNEPTVSIEEETITNAGTLKETSFEEQSPTKSPGPTMTTAVPKTSAEPSTVTFSPLPNDSHSRKVFSLQDLYKIMQFIQTGKDKPTDDLWNQILIKLNLNKHKDSELDKDGRNEGFDITDRNLEHNSYTFDLWFQQQLDGFSESDNFISLAEIKEYVRNILLENGMIVTMEGLLTDIQGAVLDLRGLKMRPILIGKPLNIGKIFEQKNYKSDFLLPSDSPYMQAIVVTLSYPSMILGIIPLGKTTIQKTVKKRVTVPPFGKGMIKKWMQNGNKFGKFGTKICGKNCENVRKENWWFNIKGRPKLEMMELKDFHLYSPAQQSKNVKYFNSPNKKYKLESSKLLNFFKENNHMELEALKNQLFSDQKKLATEKDLLTAGQNNGVVPTGEEHALSWNVDSNELEAWENRLKDTIRPENDWLTAWKNKANAQTDSEQISSLNVHDSIELENMNNQLIMNSKLIPANELPNWSHLGHLQAGSVLDPIELDALNWHNREKVYGGHGKVISFEADQPGELNALKILLLKNRNLFGKAGMKLLAALQRNDIVKPGIDETITYKGDDLKELDQLWNLLLDPTIFAKMAKELLSVLHSKGIVLAGNGEADKFQVNYPRELEALRNQLLSHPNIFARAGKELLSFMDHNGIVLSDIAPVINETDATLKGSAPPGEDNLYSEEYDLPSEDAFDYYDKVEDDITGRIVGGSAATGSGAPLSMKGRMKDFN